MSDPYIIFVDDEEHLRNAVSQTFDLAGHDIACYPTAQDALARLTPDFPGVVVSDIRMPAIDGVEFLAKVHSIDPDIPVVLVTGHGDIDLAVQCLKDGAYDFIQKPWSSEVLVGCVQRGLTQRQLILENRALKTQVMAGDRLVRDQLARQLYGRSPVMTQLRQAVAAVAATDLDTVVSGPTGAGKEVVARLLHAQSSRADKPFVHINCAALPETLIESELFGHEAGAFPGAMRARYGKLEHASGGTLCLDEIDLLPLPLQAKLLHVLDSRTITRLGSNEEVELNVRVLALAKSDLAHAVQEGRFRADLLYRLNVAALTVPSLDDRREDIPGLFTLFTNMIAKHHDMVVPDMPPHLFTQLMACTWPGNVRELRNLAERFVFGLSDLASGVRVAGAGITGAGTVGETLSARMSAYERSQIVAAIDMNGGRLKPAYEQLGISRKALYDKMQKYGLQRTDFGVEEDG